jgi:hypothetical protein
MKGGLGIGELEIIRTSVDRPDISLHFTSCQSLQDACQSPVPISTS